MRIPAGVLLGVGLGGFADGITLHQIMQWHNMGSAILPPHTMNAMSTNMRWDGWFHLATLAITVAGVFRLWSEGRRFLAPKTSRILLGQMFFGWGAFNLLEGVIDHHVLNLHHVRDLPVHVPAYDWLFLVIGGLGFLAIGKALTKHMNGGD